MKIGKLENDLKINFKFGHRYHTCVGLVLVVEVVVTVVRSY